MIETAPTHPRGRPLAMLGLLLASWIGARTMLWENPFPLPAILPGLPELVSHSQAGASATAARPPRAVLDPGARGGQAFARVRSDDRTGYAGGWSLMSTSVSTALPPPGGMSFAQASRFALAPQVALGHQLLWASALAHMPAPRSVEAALWRAGRRGPSFPALYSEVATPPLALDRLSLDAWGFWRQRSNASAISQGRVPIYGASQIGANLQFRLAPRAGHDPRLYARAYRALVSAGESELAAGFSVRPLAQIPLRAQAELRVTDSAIRTEVRPAAMVVTELAPQPLPGGLVAEAYGQAGYVGGTAATAFADGQALVSREVARFDLSARNPARLSIGAGVWGGAQKDAARVDLGPSVRVDLTIGKVPARLSLDWRERVAGDAAPDSGVAGTLSTRF
jgi:hypothetical protein